MGFFDGLLKRIPFVSRFSRKKEPVNNVELQFNKAMNLMDNGDAEESVSILEQVADIGIMDAQYKSYGDDALLALAEFFEKGKASLKPMNLLDIAQELDVHESTVSRAVRDKYLECRWGIFELKYFFSNKTSDGNNCNVLTCIQEIIRSENKQKPLSDAKIAEQLEKKGIRISRRTVTKYREQMQIPNTQMRKEYV